MRTCLLLLALGCKPSPEAEPPGTGDPTPSDPADPDPSDPVDPPEPTVSSVIVNEVMPGNQSTLNPPTGDTKPDWIELVNIGDAPAPLSGLTLANAEGESWTGTADDGEIAPGEHFVVHADEDTDQDGVFTGFPLDKDGDTLTLSSNGAVLDTLDLPALDSDVSLARMPDLTGPFVATAWPTPGAENGELPSPTLNAADETVFRTDVVHEIAFSMTQQVYNRLDQGDRPEVHVEVALDDVIYADVGLKLKGSASYDTMNGKPAFILDFNNWVEGTKFRGLKAIKLHNGNVLDPTRTRDHLSYQLAREAGLMAPRVGWAHVTVNGEDYGIYMMIEKHDDEMIEYHHPDQAETGVVMEPNESSSGGWGFGDFGNGVSDWNYEEGPIPPDPATVTALEQADRLIGGQPTDERVAELWSYVNKDQFLTYMAWETVVMHTDGYRAPNNWRIYIDGTTHLIEWSPSGAEWTWDSNVSTFSSNGAAARWCLQNQGCSHDYAEKVLIVADLADALDLSGQFETLSQFLDPWIQSDPRYNTWQPVPQARASTREHLANNPADARQEVGQVFPDLVP